MPSSTPSPARSKPSRPTNAQTISQTQAIHTNNENALAADADVVLGVAGGIVGIAAGIVRAEVRLSRVIDRLIGVAAGEHERHKSQNDRDPHSRSSSSMIDGAAGLCRATRA